MITRFLDRRPARHRRRHRLRRRRRPRLCRDARPLSATRRRASCAPRRATAPAAAQQRAAILISTGEHLCADQARGEAAKKFAAAARILNVDLAVARHRAGRHRRPVSLRRPGSPSTQNWPRIPGCAAFFVSSRHLPSARAALDRRHGGRCPTFDLTFAGPRATLTLDRPAKRNALTLAMWEELPRLVEQAMADAGGAPARRHRRAAGPSAPAPTSASSPSMPPIPAWRARNNAAIRATQTTLARAARSRSSPRSTAMPSAAASASRWRATCGWRRRARASA